MTRHTLSAPLFITGTQRSGTTLLHQILAASSSVWSQNEVYPLHYPLFAKPSAKNNRRFTEAMHEFFGTSHETSRQHLQPKQKATLFDQEMSVKATQTQKQRWCLKDPQCTYHLYEYANAFPDAKFLVLVRDPRAVCRSYLDTRGFTVGRPTNWIVAAERWKREVNMQKQFASTESSRVMWIHYEALITDFPTTLQAVCDFSNMEVEQAMLNYHRQSPAVKLHDGNENITKPPDKRKIESWKEELPESAIATIESITKPLMAELGYKPLQPDRSISRSRRFFARFSHKVISEYRWKRYRLKGKT